ncbi:MAG: nucleotide excision repair endonuclease [Bacteroidota bacterium]
MTLDLFEGTSQTQKERINKAIGELPPHEPGVYTMFDSSDRVLYVGKAKDLQKRVTSYRYTSSRKVQRMIAHVSRISYEICKTETDAILLENLLIRSMRPPFNVANKKPETYYYISTKRSGYDREFRLSMRPFDDYSETFGCFKGHLKTRRGLGALLRLLWLYHKPVSSAAYLPSQLLKRITPMRFQLRMEEKCLEETHALLKGTSTDILDRLQHTVQEQQFVDRFTRNYFDQELELLGQFYILGPNRNAMLKDQLGLDGHIIHQQELDDYLAMV